jgi:hypothetical protein
MPGMWVNEQPIRKAASPACSFKGAGVAGAETRITGRITVIKEMKLNTETNIQGPVLL